MIMEVSRSFIRAKIDSHIITVKGEMFFPENGKMGFVIYRDKITHWDSTDAPLDDRQIDNIIAVIRAEFTPGGNVLEVE